MEIEPEGWMETEPEGWMETEREGWMETEPAAGWMGTKLSGKIETESAEQLWTQQDYLNLTQESKWRRAGQFETKLMG